MVNRRWWDLAALATVAVVVSIPALEPPYGPNEWIAWAVTAAFLLFYVVYARSRIGVERTSHLTVLAIAFTVFVTVGSAAEPSYAFVQAFMYPFLWISAPSTRSAIVANIAVGSGIAIGYVIRFGTAGLATGLAVAAISVGFSIALGLWITRIAVHGEERGRLLEELQAAQGELATMHREAGVVDERGRVAREIHDTIAQTLTGLVMVAQRAGNRLAAVDGPAADAARDDIALMEEMAREALTEARGLVAALTPVAVDTTLADALARLAASFERETGVHVHVDAHAAALGPELEVVLLRTAQEGLANVRKHSRARTAWISVQRGDAAVRLSVRDDGIGPGDAAPADHGFGIAGIRERVALVGGTAELAPADGGGALLRVDVPLAETGEDPEASAPEGGRA